MHRDRIESFALDPSISEDEARAELERVLGDSEFHSTERNKKFLRFVSEELFRGRSEAVKAYSVAVDVFGRPATFDPAIDPIVRIEATRLRASLARYYERHGRSGGIYVDLPKGRYVPVFGRLETDGSGSTPPSPALPVAGGCPEETEKEPKLQAGPRRKRAVIALMATGLALLGAASLADVFGGAGAEIVSDKPRVLVEAGSAGDASGAGTLQELELLLGALARFQTLRVAADRHSSSEETELGDRLLVTNAASSAQRRSYRVTIRYLGDGSSRSASWQLLDAATGEILMSGEERPRGDEHGQGGSSEQLAAQVASRLAGVRGVINSIETARELENPTLGNGCLLRAYLALRQAERGALDTARDCLERTLALRKGAPEAYAALARVLLAIDPVDSPTALTNRAIELADKAASLGPYSDRAAEAQMLALRRVGRTHAAIAAGRRAMSLNPDNADISAGLSGILLVSGQWSDAVAMATVSERIDSGLSPDAELTMAFDEYRRGRFDAVLRRLQQLGTPAGFEATILGAAALAELGRAADARNMRMAHPRSLRAAMAARSFAPELIGMIETGLAKAGIGID